MRVRRWLGFGLLGAAAYLAVLGGEYSVFDLKRVERERAAEARDVERLEQELDDMRARIDSLETAPAALERIARERYGLIRDGERLYRFTDGDETGSDDGAEGGEADGVGDGGDDSGADDEQAPDDPPR